MLRSHIPQNYENLLFHSSEAKHEIRVGLRITREDEDIIPQELENNEIIAPCLSKSQCNYSSSQANFVTEFYLALIDCF